MPYQPFNVAPANVNHVTFLWGMHNLYSAQGVETKEILAVDSAEEQEPEYKGPHINFHISATPVHPNPYIFVVIIPPFPNNFALQYAHFGASLAPNVQPGGHITQDGTPTSQTWNLNLMHKMFPQFMPLISAQSIVQPPPRVSTQRVLEINPSRPTEYQLLEE